MGNLAHKSAISSLKIERSLRVPVTTYSVVLEALTLAEPWPSSCRKKKKFVSLFPYDFKALYPHLNRLYNDVNIVYVIESAAYGVICTSCLCQKPERARYERVRAFDKNNECI